MSFNKPTKKNNKEIIMTSLISIKIKVNIPVKEVKHSLIMINHLFKIMKNDLLLCLTNKDTLNLQKII